MASLVATDRATTADLLAHIAEVDTRRSMFSYCVHELHLSEEVAFKRIRAARVARQFPATFECLADGRLHVTAVVLLAPYLAEENAGELLAAATHRTKAEIEQVLADRFPRPDVPTLVRAVSPTLPEPDPHLASSPAQLDPDPVEAPTPPSRVAPLSPKRYSVQFTMEEDTHDKFCCVQELLGNSACSRDVGKVFDRALDSFIRELRQQKHAATARPHRHVRPSANPRHIPAHVKRAVWERDGGQCTFVSEGDRRCAARKFLEFDHIQPVARGGRATAGARARAAAEEVIAPLRVLGFRADESRRAAARCENMPEASLEQRVRRALTYFHPRARSVVPAATSLGSAP